MIDGKQCTSRFDTLKSGRSNFETIWEEVAERVIPNYVGFTGKRTVGEKKGAKMFDSTASVASDRLVGILMTIIMPPGQKYSFLRSKSPKLQENKKVREWYSLLNDQIYNLREDPKSFFRSNIAKAFFSFIVFGNGILFDEDKKPGIRYKNIPLQEIVWDENEDGGIDTVYRLYEYTGRQCIQEFGKDKCPKEIIEKYNQNPNDETKYEIIHLVCPREDLVKDAEGLKGMPFASYNILKKDGTILKEGGYNTFPYQIFRWTVIPGEKYGRGPVMTSLPDIKTLNEMDKSVLEAVHFAIRPLTLLSDDGILNEFKYAPGQLVYGGLDATGNRKVDFLSGNGNIPIAENEQDRRRTALKEALFTNIFNILQENPRMTATEIVERAKEKGELLSPIAATVQSELLSPLVEREIDILLKSNTVPKPPKEIIENGDYDIVYDSPMSTMIKAREVSSIMSTLNMLAPMANIDQNVLKYIDLGKVGKMASIYNGVPEYVIRSDDEVQAMDEQAAAQVQAQQDLVNTEATKNQATAAKDIATAQNIGEQNV